MQSWDLKTQYIPTQPRTEGSLFENRRIHSGHFWETEAGNVAYAQARNLAKEGWELVSVVPETMGTHYGAAGYGGIVTGYVLFFKRPQQ